MNLTPTELQRVFGFSGSLVVQRRAGRAVVSYVVDLDEAEVDRRLSRGVGPILDRGVINALWELPADIDYPLSALPMWVIERVRKTDAVAVSDVVRRTVRPPVHVQGAVATGARLRTLLDVLGPLSSVCPTGAILDSSPAPHDHSLLQAQRFGVGVAITTDSDPEVRVQPARLATELGAYQWHVAELVYDSIVTAGEVQPTR